VNIPVSCIGLLIAAIYVKRRDSTECASSRRVVTDAFVVKNQSTRENLTRAWKTDQRVENVTYVEVNGGTRTTGLERTHQEGVQLCRKEWRI
jgi:hypothetical protein